MTNYLAISSKSAHLYDDDLDYDDDTSESAYIYDDPDKFNKSIFLGFGSMNVNVKEQVHTVTFPGFIASIGGNLGLFLGFSFLAVAFEICDYVLKHISR